MKSRYIKTSIIKFNNQQAYSAFNVPSWLDNLRTDDLINYYITNDLSGRPDMLSTRLYSTPDFYWALIYINKPIDPTSWPKAGTVIKIIKSEIMRANG